LIPTANRLMNSLGDLRWRKGPLERIHHDFTELQVNGSGARIDRGEERCRLQDGIAFDHVSFKYDGVAPFALEDLSFEVKRGQSVGIVGATGAGKSTVIDVLLGLLEPHAGRVTADGVDIQQSGARYRRAIGYVPQHIFLADDSVRRNVALGVDDAQVDDERVWAALRMAQLEDFVRTLPEALETCVGEGGTLLSGGQRQRIGIARALYHDPDVLVFDEATSSLDVTTEADVTRAIESLLGVKTMVVVAHRLSTVRRCDQLLLLAGGRLQAKGTYDELVRDEPMFRKMALETE
jgi:ATP-binding cassette subfamily C protein